MVEIEDFEVVGPVELEVIDAYRGRVPDDVIDIWERYGYGSFGGGYVRVINPKEYQDALGAEGIGRIMGDRVSIPIMVTAMADLITWEPGTGVVGILFRDQDTTGVGDSIETVLELVAMNDAEIMEFMFKWGDYPNAVERYGVPAYEDAFMYVPLRSLGGDGTVDTLKTGKALAGIAVMLEIQGPVEH